MIDLLTASLITNLVLGGLVIFEAFVMCVVFLDLMDEIDVMRRKIQELED